MNRCQANVLSLLIKKGAELDCVTIRRQLTPLQKAVAKQYTECAKILLDNNCDVNLQVSNLSYHYPSFYYILLSFIHFQDADGDTPLHNAAYRKRSQMIGGGDGDGIPQAIALILKSDRANLNLRNKKGSHVLHVAVMAGNLRFGFYSSLRMSTLNNLFNDSSFFQCCTVSLETLPRPSNRFRMYCTSRRSVKKNRRGKVVHK